MPKNEVEEREGSKFFEHEAALRANHSWMRGWKLNVSFVVEIVERAVVIEYVIDARVIMDEGVEYVRRINL